MKKVFWVLLFVILCTSCTNKQSQFFIFKRFSSEASRVEYYKTDFYTPSQIEKINIAPCLLEDARVEPIWSPNGKYYGCSSMDGQSLIIYDIDNNKVLTKVNKIQSGSISGWSPDSQTVGVMDPGWVDNPYYDFSVMKYDGTQFHQIYESSLPLGFENWSPNGKYVSLEVFPDEIKGSGFIVIVNNLGKEIARFNLLKITNAVVTTADEIKWSPDSKKLAFTTSYNMESYSNKLYILDIKRGETINILHDESLCIMNISDWSPDGKKLLFKAVDCKNHIPVDFFDKVYYSINADGSELKPLTQKGDGLLTWTLDGKSMIVSGYGNDSSDKGLYLINADGSNKRKLLDNGYFVSWIKP